MPLLALLGLGLALAVANAGLPFVNYSMVYVKAAAKVLGGEVSLAQLVADPNAHAYQKPLGAVLGLLPFVAALGYRIGPIAHSCVTAALFALAAYAALGRLCRRLDLPRDRLGAAVVVTFLNPVAVYQFWAIGPDALLAAAFAAAFALLDRALEALADRPAGARAPVRAWLWLAAYLLAAYATVAIKFYGLVAIPIHALYVAALVGSGRLRLRALAPLAAVGAILLLGVAIYPGAQILGTKDFARLVEMATGLAAEGRQSGAIAKEGRLAILAGNAVMVVSSLLLTLNVLVVCLVRRYRRAELPILAAVALFVLGLMLHRGSYYNLRFMLPIAPFVAALVVGSPRFASRRLVAAYLVVGALLVAVFNVQNPLPSAMGRRGEGKATVAGRALRTFSNLGIGTRMRARELFAQVEERVPAGAPLVVATSYFGDAYHGTLELTGFLRPPGEVRYYRRCREVEPPAAVFYLMSFDRRCALPFPCRREAIGDRLERITVAAAEAPRRPRRAWRPPGPPPSSRSRAARGRAAARPRERRSAP